MKPTEIRDIILNTITEPVVFKNLIQSWPSSKWDFTNISQIFYEKLLKFRIGKNNAAEVNLETECDYKHATISEFCQWLENTCDDGNPFKNLPINEYWCYADYKHMCEIFEGESEMFQNIDWSGFGFPGRDGKESTIWIGSRGASTVCHFDTYGCNLVAQICGRKRWILFPPSQSEAMYPTRLPFEESSHFSRVNILRPDLERFPMFKATTPYMVTLNPGDVLFVPHHWWHHVECLEPSISINTWLELEVDHLERVREAVARNIVFKMMDGCEQWLNPTEEYTSYMENLDLLNLATNAYSLKKKEYNDEGDEGDRTEAILVGRARKRTNEGTENVADKFSKKFKPNLRRDKSNGRGDDINDIISIKPEFEENDIIRIQPSSIADLKGILSRDKDGVQNLDNDGRNKEGSRKEDTSYSVHHPTHMSNPSVASQIPGCSKSHQYPQKMTIEQLTISIMQQNVIKLITENLLNSIGNNYQ